MYSMIGKFITLIFFIIFFTLLIDVNIVKAVPNAPCSDTEACDEGEHCVSARCRTEDSDSVNRCQCGQAGGEPYVNPAPDSLQDCCRHCGRDEDEIVRWNDSRTDCPELRPSSGGSCISNASCSSGQICMNNVCQAPTGSRDVGTGVDYDAWRQRQMDAAQSVERGIFTEGLTTECMAFGDCKTCDIFKVVENVFSFAFQIVGIIAVFVIFIGGITYIRSGGNEETAGKAKKIIAAAVIGTLVVFSAWIIINTILNMTGFNIGGTWWSPSC